MPVSLIRRNDDELAELYAKATHARERAVLMEAIVRVHEPLVKGFASRFVGKGVERLDLEQVASIGLIKALERFDPTTGSSFKAYAIPTILGELRRHFRDRAWAIRVPRALQELSNNIAKLNKELAEQCGRPCSLAELAAHFKTDEDTIQEALLAQHAYAPASLDEPLRNRHGHEESLQLNDQRALFVEKLVDRLMLELVMTLLPERERRILRLRFYHDLSQAEIGEVIGVSQMQVSRLLSRSLEKLRRLSATIPDDPEEVNPMAKKSGLQYSNQATNKVISVLAANSGQVSNTELLAWLVRETGYKAGDLNALLTEMSAKNIVHRRFNERHKLVELRLRPGVDVPAVAGSQLPRPTNAPAKADQLSVRRASSKVPRPIQELVELVRTRGLEGQYVAASVEDAARGLGMAPSTLGVKLITARRLGLLETMRRGGNYYILLAGDQEQAGAPPEAEMAALRQRCRELETECRELRNRLATLTVTPEDPATPAPLRLAASR